MLLLQGAGKAPEEPEESQLPEIQGLDWVYAKRFVQEERVLLGTLKTVYQSIKGDQKQLTELYENLHHSVQQGSAGERSSAMAAYRIKVHALKSTNASIGAVRISQLAAFLEEKALEDDPESIEKLHPFLLEELGKMGDRLADYYGAQSSGQERGELTDDILRERLQELSNAMEDFDSDRADEIVEELCGYQTTPDMQERLDDLKEHEFQLDFEACEVIVKEILQKIA
jgi:HPt (histidine-containing phosphotransfer) domain-containing protein